MMLNLTSLLPSTSLPHCALVPWETGHENETVWPEAQATLLWDHSVGTGPE